VSSVLVVASADASVGPSSLAVTEVSVAVVSSPLVSVPTGGGSEKQPQASSANAAA
jgi:hypothetical protein